MDYGLRCFDSSGNVTIDITDRLTRFHSDYSVSLSYNQTTTIAINGFVDDGTWVVICDNYWYTITRNSGSITLKNNYGGTSPGYIQVYKI